MGFKVDLEGLEDKWTRQCEQYPVCAVCGLRIGAEEHEEGCYMEGYDPNGDQSWGGECTCKADDVPIQLFRGKGRRMRCLSFHEKCFQGRVKAVGKSEYS